MNSLYNEFHDKYSQKANLFMKNRIKEISYKNELDFKKSLGLKDENTSKLFAMKYKTIIDRFIYGNSFVGNEIAMIRYFLYQITIWNLIAVNESINEQNRLTCAYEIEILFYNFINVVYNLKEKVEKFVLFNKGKKIENVRSILNDKSQKEIGEIFKNEYKNIKVICESRNFLVHDSFAMNYDYKKQVIHFSVIDFDLSINCLYKRKPHLKHYSVNEEELDKYLQSIERIVYGTVEVLSDYNCIDAKLFLQKFAIYENGKKTIKITF